MKTFKGLKNVLKSFISSGRALRKGEGIGKYQIGTYYDSWVRQELLSACTDAVLKDHLTIIPYPLSEVAASQEGEVTNNTRVLNIFRVLKNVLESLSLLGGL